MNSNLEPISKYISILYRSASMYFNHKFVKYNISSGQYPFLIHLLHNEGVTQEEMSCRINLDKGTTAKALKKLEDVGYVLRVVDDKDKRAYRVFLTDEGKRVAKEVHIILHHWNDILTSDFSEEEQELSLKLLKKMLENKNNFLNKGDYKCLKEKKD